MPSIFLLQHGATLVEMTQQPYESEDLLQELLAEHPGVLAGDQFNSAESKRWLLISREAGVPAEDGGNDRWSLDHLFVDQDGIPTLVEVKRSSDTRIRREVIGQMFDYAANAVVYWPIGQIRTRFEQECELAGVNPDQRLADFLQASSGPEESETEGERFWSEVDTNLRAGRIRMVLVADLIAPELRRIVEFLNGQMNPAEVLAIEIKQFAASGVTTLVPTVIGQTAQAAARRDRTIQPGRQWDRIAFFEALSARKGRAACNIAESLFAWCDHTLSAVWWGKGSQDGSCFRGLTHNGKNAFLFAVYTSGKMVLQFKWLKRFPPFDSDASRIALLQHVNQIPGITFGPEVISRLPSFDLMLLVDPAATAQFYKAMEWVIAEIRSN